MINIIKGEDKDITVRLLSEVTGEPFDLSSASQISTGFKNADGTQLALSVTGGSVSIITALLGKFKVTLTAAQSAALQTGNNYKFECAVTIAGKISKCQILNAYSVVDKIN